MATSESSTDYSRSLDSSQSSVPSLSLSPRLVMEVRHVPIVSGDPGACSSKDMGLKGEYHLASGVSGLILSFASPQCLDEDTDIPTFIHLDKHGSTISWKALSTDPSTAPAPAPVTISLYTLLGPNVDDENFTDIHLIAITGIARITKIPRGDWQPVNSRNTHGVCEEYFFNLPGDDPSEMSADILGDAVVSDLYSVSVSDSGKEYEMIVIEAGDEDCSSAVHRRTQDEGSSFPISMAFPARDGGYAVYGIQPAQYEQ